MEFKKHISKRLNTQSIGYSNLLENQKLTKGKLNSIYFPQDLKSFGLIPELIGRMLYFPI